eukprot:g8835.t1
MLGGIALCFFVYSLKSPAISTASHGASRRLEDAPALRPSLPNKRSRSLELYSRPTRTEAGSEVVRAAGGGAGPLSETTAPPAAGKKEARSLAAATNGGGDDSGGCWIFMHLQKCGGSTVKKMLKDTWDSRYFVYDSMRWKFGDDFARTFGDKLASGHPWNVMAGGYPEALRGSAAVDASCRFFTVFRHPVARLVSAYFYCQLLEGDVACASNIVRAKDVDLITFAAHWSNFAVRQFALSLVSADDVMAYARSPQAMALLPESVESLDKVAGWYLLKMYLERPDTEANGTASGHDQPNWATTAITARATGQEVVEEGEKVPDAEMYGFLQPAQDLLSYRYAAVGILEEWNTTLALFDEALDMPGMDWQREFQQEGRQNVDESFQQLKAETLEKALTDPELEKYLRLDLQLYEHAVAVFRQQARFHGLRVSE